MVRLIWLLLQASLVALILYNMVTALWGWPDRRPAPRGSRRRQLRVVIPAHNEGQVIAAILGDLHATTYGDHQTWVIADRCDDDTAAIARRLGATVEERNDGAAGKGAALAWHLDRHPLEPEEVLVVFDADNRVPVSALTDISDEVDNGHDVVQCYLDVGDSTGSLIAEASALSYWAGNRMVQLARSNLGWSADLGGTGMAITSEALSDAGGFKETLTEDQDLGVRLLLAGHRVEWAHHVKIIDEKPRSLSVTLRQRARWMAGKRIARRRHLITLLKKPTPARLDMVVRLLQPGRSFLALVSVVMVGVAAVTGSPWFVSWEVWAVVAAIQFLLPMPFLAREGVAPRQLLRYPLLSLLAVLWIPIRILSTRVDRWYHTPHIGINASTEDETGP